MAHKDQIRHGSWASLIRPIRAWKPPDRAASSSSAASTTSSASSPPRSFPSSSYPCPSGVSPASSPSGSSSSPSPSSAAASSPAPSPSAAFIHVWTPVARRPHRPPLVLIHGFGGDAKWQLERQIWPLSRSFDLYIPDLVFFSRSRADGEDRSVGFQARCVAEAMRCLGVERYAVVGISYGGFVAFRMAEMAEEAVELVVILTAGISLTAKQRRELAGREERDASEILLPQRAKDLIILLRRSMYRPPWWIPAFLLRHQRAKHAHGPPGVTGAVGRARFGFRLSGPCLVETDRIRYCPFNL